MKLDKTKLKELGDIIVLDFSDVELDDDGELTGHYEFDGRRIKAWGNLDCDTFIDDLANDLDKKYPASDDIEGSWWSFLTDLFYESLEAPTSEIGPQAIKYDNGDLSKVPRIDIIKAFLIDGELPEQYQGFADKIEPQWRSLLDLEKSANEPEDDDLLKALEKVSK